MAVHVRRIATPTLRSVEPRTSLPIRSRKAALRAARSAPAILFFAVWAPLPDRDDEPVEVGGDDQPGLAARQREHRAVLIGQHNRARAPADRGVSRMKVLKGRKNRPPRF